MDNDNLHFEKILWKQDFHFIAGVDEVGRGCFAGPVVCACVIMPKDFVIENLTDSKKIPKKKHKYFYDLVTNSAISFGIGIVNERTIEKINIQNSSRLGMKLAIENMVVQPDFILVDGKEVIDTPVPQQSIIKGDFLSHSISAASIIAKYTRDELMKELDNQFDFIYKWSQNAGYPTQSHILACQEYGITSHHRKTWSTMNKMNLKRQ